MMTRLIGRSSAALMLAAAAALFAPSAATAVGVGKTCGGIRGIQCDYGLFCDLRAGQCKGADIDGKCVRIPKVCTRIFKPVCGCDGKTYGNDCDRQTAKVQKDHNGKCQ
jgi:hypothetical protein